MALNSTGRSLEAVTVLEEALARAPLVRNLLLAIATIRRDRGERGAALRHAGTLVRYRPDDAGVRQLYAELAGTSPRQ